MYANSRNSGSSKLAYDAVRKAKSAALQALVGVGDGSLSAMSDEELEAVKMTRYSPAIGARPFDSVRKATKSGSGMGRAK